MISFLKIILIIVQYHQDLDSIFLSTPILSISTGFYVFIYLRNDRQPH